MRWRSLLRWKNALNCDYKNNNGRNFQFTKLSFIDFVLTERRSLSGKGPKSTGRKSSSCRFSFPAERNANHPLQAQWFLRVTVTVKMTGLFLQISRARCKAEHGLHSSLVLILHICSPRDHPVDANRFKLHLSKYKKATLNLRVFNIQE